MFYLASSRAEVGRTEGVTILGFSIAADSCSEQHALICHPHRSASIRQLRFLIISVWFHVMLRCQPQSENELVRENKRFLAAKTAYKVRKYPRRQTVETDSPKSPPTGRN